MATSHRAEKEGWRRLPDNSQGRPEWEHIQTGMIFVELPPAEGQTEPTLMAKYHVTQSQWEAVMGNNPSHFTRCPIEIVAWGSDLPVESVSWHDCQEFCKRTGLSLPTEEELEYACRAGSEGLYCFGDDESKLGEYAWYSANSDGHTHPVGQKKPNNWGLHDVHGLVWSWSSSPWRDKAPPRLRQAKDQPETLTPPTNQGTSDPTSDSAEAAHGSATPTTAGLPSVTAVPQANATSALASVQKDKCSDPTTTPSVAASGTTVPSTATPPLAVGSSPSTPAITSASVRKGKKGKKGRSDPSIPSVAAAGTSSPSSVDQPSASTTAPTSATATSGSVRKGKCSDPSAPATAVAGTNTQETADAHSDAETIEKSSTAIKASAQKDECADPWPVSSPVSTEEVPISTPKGSAELPIERGAGLSLPSISLGSAPKRKKGKKGISDPTPTRTCAAVSEATSSAEDACPTEARMLQKGATTTSASAQKDECSDPTIPPFEEVAGTALPNAVDLPTAAGTTPIAATTSDSVPPVRKDECLGFTKYGETTSGAGNHGSPRCKKAKRSASTTQSVSDQKDNNPFQGTSSSGTEDGSASNEACTPKNGSTKASGGQTTILDSAPKDKCSDPLNRSSWPLPEEDSHSGATHGSSAGVCKTVDSDVEDNRTDPTIGATIAVAPLRTSPITPSAPTGGQSEATTPAKLSGLGQGDEKRADPTIMNSAAAASSALQNIVGLPADAGTNPQTAINTSDSESGDDFAGPFVESPSAAAGGIHGTTVEQNPSATGGSPGPTTISASARKDERCSDPTSDPITGPCMDAVGSTGPISSRERDVRCVSERRSSTVINSSGSDAKDECADFTQGLDQPSTVPDVISQTPQTGCPPYKSKNQCSTTAQLASGQKDECDPFTLPSPGSASGTMNRGVSRSSGNRAVAFTLDSAQKDNARPFGLLSGEAAGTTTVGGQIVTTSPSAPHSVHSKTSGSVQKDECSDPTEPFGAAAGTPSPTAVAQPTVAAMVMLPTSANPLPIAAPIHATVASSLASVPPAPKKDECSDPTISSAEVLSTGVPPGSITQLVIPQKSSQTPQSVSKSKVRRRVNESHGIMGGCYNYNEQGCKIQRRRVGRHIWFPPEPWNSKSCGLRPKG